MPSLYKTMENPIGKLTILFWLGFISSCTQSVSPREISGVWSVDSVYYFHNGFGFTNEEPESWPSYSFQTDGTVSLGLNDEERSFLFHITDPDSLTIEKVNQGSDVKYKILQLDKSRMILRLQKSLILSGKNQERFDIVYLSRSRE